MACPGAGGGLGSRTGRAASGERPRISLISSKGTANTSCSTNATRSAGVSRSSTTRSALPTDSARSASLAGSLPSFATCVRSSGDSASSGSSGRARRDRKRSRQTRPMTVVRKPPRFSIRLGSVRLSRSHVSCTASSASVCEPSIRYATASRRGRLASNSAVSQSSSTISTVLRGRTLPQVDVPDGFDVTRVSSVGRVRRWARSNQHCGGIVMTTVLDEPTVESLAPESWAGAVARRRRSVRRVRAGRWLAVLVLGFVTGAAVVMLTDSGTSDPSVLVNAPRRRRAERRTPRRRRAGKPT